jgi:hypothetical protein
MNFLRERHRARLSTVARSVRRSPWSAVSLGTALVVISKFYRLPVQEARWAHFPIIAAASEWTTKAVPSYRTPRAVANSTGVGTHSPLLMRVAIAPTNSPGSIGFDR